MSDTPTAVAAPVRGQTPVIVKHGSGIRVRNDYWYVEHDPARGGCPSAIVFKHGSRRNLLVQPLAAHVRLRAAEDAGTVFRQDFDARARVRAVMTRQGPEITLSGRLRDESGRALAVRYAQTYRYTAWGRVDVGLTLTFDKPLRDVCEIGVFGLVLPRRFNRLGVRPGLPPPPNGEGFCETESRLQWHELDLKHTYREQYACSQRLVPSWFAVFEQGVEGLEFWRGDVGETWDRPFGVEAGKGFFGDDSWKFTDRRHIRVEPFCNWDRSASFGPGQLVFQYTLGLPFVKSLQEARKPVFHLAINSRTWPEADALRKLADSGVSLIRLHDDNSRNVPSWRNCLYPPYDPADMRRMDQVIGLAHQFGMKIVPYFSLKEFHPDCPEYPLQAPVWKRWADTVGRIQTENGPYGGYMCMRSGWLEFRKQTIDLVLRRHAFDGVYYDHLWFRYCRHPGHAEGHWHTDAMEILDFLSWTRERVGPDGVVFLHTSGCPTLIGENLSDLIFIGEDMFRASPLPDTQVPDLALVPVTPRNWVPANAIRNPGHPDYRLAVLTQLLEHCPPNVSTHPRHRFVLAGIRRMRELALETYAYIPADANPLGLAEPGLYASLYTKPDQAVIRVANLTRRKCQAALRLPLRLLHWPSEARVRIGIDRQAPSGWLSCQAVEARLNALPLAPFQLRTLILQRAGDR